MPKLVDFKNENMASSKNHFVSLSVYHTPESESKFANISANSLPNSKNVWSVNLDRMYGTLIYEKTEFENIMLQSL